MRLTIENDLNIASALTIGNKQPTPNQRCHSKKIKIPRRATENIPENPRPNFYTIGLHFGKKSNFSWKNPTFPGKNPTFSEKSVFSPPKLKFLKTLFFFFLVVSSHF